MWSLYHKTSTILQNIIDLMSQPKLYDKYICRSFPRDAQFLQNDVLAVISSI